MGSYAPVAPPAPAPIRSYGARKTAAADDTGPARSISDRDAARTQLLSDGDMVTAAALAAGYSPLTALVAGSISED